VKVINMYLAFIDESGTMQANDPNNNYYIITAMVMQEKGMKFLHQKSQALKKEIWQLVQGTKKSMPPNFEIHLQEILDAKKYFKPLRSNIQKTEDFLNKIFQFINNLYITIISIVIVKDDFFSKYKQGELLKWSLQLLIERVNRYVWNDTKNKKDKEFALLIMDEDFTHDKKKRKFISNMMEKGVKYQTGDVDRILDTPIFLDSKLHNGIQIVDSIAYLIRRYTRKIIDKKGSSLFDELSNIFLYNLRYLFYGGESNINSNGIKFFPSSAPTNYWDVFEE